VSLSGPLLCLGYLNSFRQPAGVQVDPAATPAEIKRAYYGMAKECHPDLAGEGGHNMCVLLNR